MEKYHPMYAGLMMGVMMFGIACSEGNHIPPEGTWSCSSQWHKETDGVQVMSSSEQQNTCEKGVLTTTGLISIGDAQWTEKKEGTCHASKDEFYGTWSSVETVPENEEARLFEKEKLGGKSLAQASWTEPSTYCVTVISRTETRLKASGPDGKIVNCTRL